MWSIRESLGSSPLHPHATSSHTFPSPHSLQCYGQVIDKSTGKDIQLSKYSFTFRGDAAGGLVVAHVQQHDILSLPAAVEKVVDKEGMIRVANELVQAWARKDRSIYSRCVSGNGIFHPK